MHITYHTVPVRSNSYAVCSLIESPCFHFASLLRHPLFILPFYSQSSWRKYHDDDSNTDYYYDHTTGESRWDLPEGEALAEDDDEEDLGTYDETAEEPDDLYVNTR